MLTNSLIAAARADLNRHFARNLRHAAKRAMRHVRLACRRIAEAQRQRREIDLILRADDRMLADIGLTRADARFAFAGGRKAERWNAAQGRDEARAAASGSLETLPQVHAPALAPALPRHPIAHENFR